MSLEPGWSSTRFRHVLAVAQARRRWPLQSRCALAARACPRGATLAPRSVLRDLGNLLLVFVLLWAYLEFMQFLIIWIENLPREIAWYLPRCSSGWRWVALALVLLQFALPFLVLLFRHVKERRARLAAIALWLLLMPAARHGVARAAGVAPHGCTGSTWLLPLAIGGMLLLCCSPAARRGCGTRPTRDARSRG